MLTKNKSDVFGDLFGESPAKQTHNSEYMGEYYSSYNFKKLSYSVSHSQDDYTISYKSLLFVDKFGHSIRFCQIEFYKEAIYEGLMAHSCVFRGGGEI